MSEFSRQTASFCAEIKADMAKVVSLVEASLNEGGKDASIELVWTPRSEFDARAELVRSGPDTGKLPRGGDYRVILTDGLLVKLVYGYEIILTVMARTLKRPPDAPIHTVDTRMLSGSTPSVILHANYLKLDLQSQLVDASSEPFDPELLSAELEEAFWPFQITDRIVDKATRQHVTFAVAFLILHECYHIGRGHLDYLHDTRRRATIAEAYSFDDAGGDTLLRHLMEFDADQQAIINIMLNQWNEREDTAESWASVVTTSLIILFSLFDLTAHSTNAYQNRKHPDPDVRILAAAEYACIVYSHVGNTGGTLNAVEFAQTMRRSLWSAAESAVWAFHEMGIIGGGPTGLFIDDGAEVSEAAGRLFRAAVAAQDQWRHRARSSIDISRFES